MLLYSIPALFVSFVLSLHSLCFVRLSAAVAVSLRRCRLLLLLSFAVVVFFHLFLWNFCMFRFILNFIFCWLCVAFVLRFHITTLSICRLSVVQSDSMLCFALCVVCVCVYFSSLDSIRNPDAGCCHTFSALCVSLSLVHSLALYRSECMLLGNVCLCLFFHSIRRFSFHYTTMTA